MGTIWKCLNAYLTADNIALALILVGICAFSVLAARAEARLWNKTRRIKCRRRQQQFITEARGRLR